MKKRDILISFLLIMSYLLFLFYTVNFNWQELGLSMKTMLGQELTLEEMKSTSIYKAYNQIGNDTDEKAISSILNKKSSSSFLENLSSWNYPYGSLSVIYRQEEQPYKVYFKTVSFKRPIVRKLTEEELYSILESSSLDGMFRILGETAMLGESYEKDGSLVRLSYEWRVKTKLTKEFVEEAEKKLGESVSFPISYKHPADFLKLAKKYRLKLWVNADNSIDRVYLEDYRR